ncbi:hypothetical protein M3Y99_01901800 [Aphelenchoides fujianensis]|nr:hypothetical protein M3Y99_01901800 [Aphelenchoides fujianensis]
MDWNNSELLDGFQFDRSNERSGTQSSSSSSSSAFRRTLFDRKYFENLVAQHAGESDATRRTRIGDQKPNQPSDLNAATRKFIRELDGRLPRGAAPAASSRPPTTFPPSTGLYPRLVDETTAGPSSSIQTTNAEEDEGTPQDLLEQIGGMFAKLLIGFHANLEPDAPEESDETASEGDQEDDGEEDLIDSSLGESNEQSSAEEMETEHATASPMDITLLPAYLDDLLELSSEIVVQLTAEHADWTLDLPKLVDELLQELNLPARFAQQSIDWSFLPDFKQQLLVVLQSALPDRPSSSSASSVYFVLFCNA